MKTGISVHAKIDKILFLFTLALIVTCGTLENFKEPAPDYTKTRKLARRTPTVAEIRIKINALVYKPNQGQGFDYKETTAGQDLNIWVLTHKSVLEIALFNMPAGFQLLVIGHTDSVGPRLPDPGTKRKGNLYYSRERARLVYQALITAGLPADKIGYAGIADDELLKDRAHDDPGHRRVTFRITMSQ